MRTTLSTGRYVAVVSLLALGVALVAAGQPPRADEAQVTELLAGLRSPDIASRRAGKEAVSTFYVGLQEDLGADGRASDLPAYQSLVGGLIEMVAEERQEQDYEMWDRKLLAVELLGEMRAAEAVDVLLDNLWFRASGLVTERALETIYPCVGALIRIGEPSVEGILRRADRQYEEKDIGLLAIVVRYAMAREAGLGRCEAELQRAERRVDNLRDIVANLERE